MNRRERLLRFNVKNSSEHIELQFIKHWDEPYETKPAGVNWPAKGTVTVKEAKEFCAKLKKAISFAEKLNKEVDKPKRCPHCNNIMLLAERYSYCRDSKCNWIEFHKS